MFEAILLTIAAGVLVTYVIVAITGAILFYMIVKSIDPTRNPGIIYSLKLGLSWPMIFYYWFRTKD